MKVLGKSFWNWRNEIYTHTVYGIKEKHCKGELCYHRASRFGAAFAICWWEHLTLITKRILKFIMLSEQHQGGYSPAVQQSDGNWSNSASVKKNVHGTRRLTLQTWQPRFYFFFLFLHVCAVHSHRNGRKCLKCSQTTIIQEIALVWTWKIAHMATFQNVIVLVENVVFFHWSWWILCFLFLFWQLVRYHTGQFDWNIVKTWDALI